MRLLTPVGLSVSPSPCDETVVFRYFRGSFLAILTQYTLSINFFTATTCMVYFGDDGRVNEVVAVPHGEKWKNSKIFTERKGTGLGVFVKFVPLVAFTGMTLATVYVFADSSMGTDDVVVKKLPGVSHQPGNNKCSYVLYAQNRGNAAVSKAIISIFVNEMITYIEKECLFGEHLVVFCDGETAMIKAIMDEKIMRKLKKHNIVLVKLGAQSSLIYQALDCGHVFSKIKGLLRKNKELTLRIKLMFEPVKDAFKDSADLMPDNHVWALLSMINAFQEVSPGNIEVSGVSAL